MSRALRTAPFLLFPLAGCQRTEKVPGYLDISDVSVSTQTGEGSGSARITEVWSYANDQPFGVWELPAKVPVLSAGTTDLKLVAGVHRNGVISDRVIYPFYDTWHQQVELIPEQHTSIHPAFAYFPQAVFWIEAFEDAGVQFDADGADTALVRLTAGVAPPEDIFEGTGSGHIALDEDHPFARYVSSEVFTFPNGGPVYLELDYRCDQRFLIGVYFTQASTVTRSPYLFVSSTDNGDGTLAWKKIYVDLSELMLIPGTSDRKFYLETYLETGRTSARFYWDNIKLVRW